MASRVNTRFVTFLAIGLMLLGGGAMVAVYFALKKSGADYVALGDKYVALGEQLASSGDREGAADEFEKAIEYYSKAVYRERTNPVYIDKWIGAMQKTTPTPRSVYLDRYVKDYLPALKAYSDALPEDVTAQKRFLGEQYERMRMLPIGSVEPWNEFIQEVEDAMKRFGSEEGPVQELRKYRAFANLYKLAIVTPDKHKELVASIDEDLSAALAVNPDDADVVAEVANMRMRRAATAREEKDEATAARLEQESVDGLADYIKKNGASSRVVWRQMQIEFVLAAQAADARRVPLTRAALYEEKHPRFVGLMDVMKAEPKEKLDLLVLTQICGEAVRSPKLGNAGVLDLLYALEAKNPDRVFLKMLIGRFEMMSQHYDKAVTAYQKVIDSPDVPLSFDGWVLFEQRADAYRQQIMAKLAARDAKDAAGVAVVTPEASAKFLSEAKTLRDTLAEYVGESERVLLFVDAKIAHAEGNYEAARIALDRYNERSSNQDVSALVLQGSIMEKLGNTGAARTAYELVLRRDGDNPQAILALADLEQREQNFPAAKRYYEAAEKLFPASLEIKERISKINLMIQAKDDPTTVEDVSVRALAEAKRLLEGLNPDYPGAAKVLRDGLKGSGDLNLYPILARVLQADGQTDAAIAVLAEGLSKAPDNAKLKAMSDALKEKDPLKASIKAIDQAEEGSAFQKHIWRHMVYAQFDKKDEAKAELDAAAKLDPDHSVILEIKFREAVLAKNMTEARRLADMAASKNSDHVDGLTYKAQVEVADGRLNDAAATLEAALEKDRNSFMVWNQLGGLRLATGKPEQAATAYERALAIRPSHVSSIKGVMKAKINAGLRDQALEVARKNQEICISDPEFVDMWLGLEAVTAGGDRAKALELREQLAKRFPDNERNNVSLVLLLMDAQRWADARTMIDKLRGAGDKPAYVQLEIRWHTAQGNLRSAIETFNRWVVTLPPDQHTEAPYIDLAGIFMDYGRYEAAMLSLEDGGRKHQDPKTMGADRKLGEVQFLTQRYSQCIETFDRVLAVDPKDPEYRLNGQIVEAYIRLSRFQDAKRRIDALGAGIESNSRMLLLKAEILAGLGQLEEAGRVYDSSVATAKDDPIGYIKRAEFLGRDPQRMGDAEQDLKQALLLVPRHLGARRMLADLHMRQNEPDKAVAVMREGLIADPENDTLRLDLVGLHLRLKQDREAIGLVEDALKRRNEDPIWLFRGREVMYALGRFDDAANYAWRLWEKKKDVDAALAYLDAALKVKNTDFVKAMEVLQTPQLNTQRDVRLLIARARLQLKRERILEATNDLNAALLLIDQNNRAQAQAFMAGMTVVYENAKDRLVALTALRPKEGYKGWMAFLYSNLKTAFPESHEEGMSELRTIAETATNELNLRKQTYALIGSRWRNEKKYDEAIRWWEEGRKLDPADPELNNNIAYCLAEDLKKPKEALPYAERAVAAMQNNPSVQDTLGTIQILLGNLEKADQALSRAMSLVQGPEEGVAVLLHLAQLRFLQDRKDEGATLVRRAEELLKDERMKEMRDQYAPLLAELKGKSSGN